MNSNEFYQWLNGYLEALESNVIEVCKIENIREKMKTIKAHYQERVVYGPNVKKPTQQGYAPPTPNTDRSV